MTHTLFFIGKGMSSTDGETGCVEKLHVERWEFEQQNHILCFVLFFFFFVHAPEVVAAFHNRNTFRISFTS